MALPGLLIEYLIVGSLALTWLYPFLERAGFAWISPSYLPLMVIGLYVIGMIIDFYAFLLLRPAKRRVRARVDQRYNIADPKVPGRTPARAAKFLLYAPEVAKEVAMRSSRDRIARGAIINAILATVLNHRVVPIWLGGFLIITSLAMWLLFEYLSYSYEVKAEQILDEKLKSDKAKV